MFLYLFIALVINIANYYLDEGSQHWWPFWLSGSLPYL